MMESIFIFFVIMALLFTLSSGLPPSTQKAEISQSQEISESTSQTTPQTETQTSLKPKTAIQKPFILVDTYIVSGLEEGEIIEETNWVAFEFDAKVSPKETEGQISFETKIEGFDDNWVPTFSKERAVMLPLVPKEYTFLVRVKIKDSIDPTPAERNFTINISPYFGKIRISSVQMQTSYSSSLIRLDTQLQEEEKINITGWRLRTKNDGFTIPGGIERYFSGLPPTKSIIVKQYDTIYLSEDSNPFGKGRNFRTNRCLGYLADFRDFPIPLSRNCPIPTREEFSHLRLTCQEFIVGIPPCDIPNYSDNLTISHDSECVYYLNDNFDYEGCFRNHSRDEDFLENEWHIYLNRNILFTNICDTLYLRDQNGFFVDKYSYGPPICHW